MRYNIYLLQYNNYYNRLHKMNETLEDYKNENMVLNVLLDKNFELKNGINSSLIVNSEYVTPLPNYMILAERNSEGIETGAFTRWFVISSDMIRGGQYEFQVLRDVISENYNNIKRSPCIIEKGYVDNNNVLVFNKEQQEYNKIKTKELLIKDYTNSAYVVGFVARDSGDVATPVTTSYARDDEVDFDYDSLPTWVKNITVIGSGTPSNYLYNKTMQNIEISNVGAQIEFEYNNGIRYIQNDGKLYLYKNLNDVDYNVTVTSSEQTLDNHIIVEGYKYSGYPVIPPVDYARDTVIKPLYNELKAITTSKLNNMSVNYDSILSNPTSNLTYLNNYIKDGKCLIEGVYYKARILSVYDSTGSFINNNYSFTAQVRNALPNDNDLLSISNYSNLTIDKDNFTSSDITINYSQNRIYVQLTQYNPQIESQLTPRNDRNHLIDNPYDMFVIPYSDDYEYIVNSTTYLANKNMAINLAQAICEASGSETYDIQIVPYCPFKIQDNDWSLINKEAIKDEQDNVIGYYFWADKSSLTFTIDETRDELTLSDNPSYKEITQLNKYILCSPDKNQQWEFNPCMNHGINKWIVSLDYRPFSSYIKIEPEFKWLYGSSYYNDLSDTRGLLMNTSYSLTQLSDAWANYINSNKNYQQIFDTQINTQIKSYDVQNKAAWDTMFARSFDIGFLGTGMIGSPIKAYYNTKEQQMNEELQGISLASQRKLFNYQLDNIKNQPDTIKKLTSINIDFRLYPFVEIYEASEQERLLFSDMIKYNGMSIMATGYIENYLKDNDETFIQAQLIRYNDMLDNTGNDFELVQAINYELNQGIYITKEEE